jgi:hypothetical protein
MKFQAFTLEKLDEIPKIERSDLRLLWHSGYWDGPTSGMLEYRGQKYWFETFYDDPDSPTYPRWQFVLRLSDEQLAEEERWHLLFREKVGTHTDYDETGRPTVGELHRETMLDEFYIPYRQRIPRDLSDAEIIAWFEV